MNQEWRPSAVCVELAELARGRGHILSAAEAAAGGMGQPTPIDSSQWLTPARIDEFIDDKDPTRMLILATLARIHVDTAKTLANRALTPGGTVHRLEEAVHTINLVYRHPSLMNALKKRDADHLGRPHDFEVEMPRDVAKVAFAAGDVLKPSQARRLVAMGEDLLVKTHDSLPQGHPTKPLLWVELQLSQALHGKKVDSVRMKEDLLSIVLSSKNNPHRVATVASWVVARAEKDGDEYLQWIAQEIFDEKLKQNPHLSSLIDRERRVLRLRPVRRVLFQAGAQLLIPSPRREQLYTSILGK